MAGSTDAAYSSSASPRQCRNYLPLLWPLELDLFAPFELVALSVVLPLLTGSSVKVNDRGPMLSLALTKNEPGTALMSLNSCF
jgi:hypothetical protein